MSRRKSLRRMSGHSIPILGRFKDIRFDFVLVVIGLILYISATSSLSLEKVVILLLGPVIAELALLGLDVYILSWVRHALPLRSLITGGFAIAIGTAIILVNSTALIVGAVIIALSIMLIAYSLWRYRLTRDFGVGSSNKIQTENTILFMSALLIFALGYVDISVVMIGCSLIVLVHMSLPFSIFITMMVGGIVHTVYNNPVYTVAVVLVEGLVQGYLKRTEIINRIKNASSLRTLITSVFGVVIGSAMVIVNQAALGEGIAVIALSVLLAIYGMWKYMATRDLGIRKQDPIGTANLVVLLLSVLAFVLGVIYISALLFSSWAVILFYRRLLFEIPIMLAAAILLQGLFSQLTYGVIIVAVGIVMAVIGAVLTRMEAEKVRTAVKAKSTGSKEK